MIITSLVDWAAPQCPVVSKNVIGSRIREARYRAGRKISQVELAARLQASGIDLDPSAISRIENQERLITDIEVVAICAVLGVAVETLFEGITPSGSSVGQIPSPSAAPPEDVCARCSKR